MKWSNLNLKFDLFLFYKSYFVGSNNNSRKSYKIDFDSDTLKLNFK